MQPQESLTKFQTQELSVETSLCANRAVEKAPVRAEGTQIIGLLHKNKLYVQNCYQRNRQQYEGGRTVEEVLAGPEAKVPCNKGNIYVDCPGVTAVRSAVSPLLAASFPRHSRALFQLLASILRNIIHLRTPRNYTILGLRLRLILTYLCLLTFS